MTKFRKSALAALVAVGVMGMAGAASAEVVGGGATLPEDLYNGTNGDNGILTSTPPGFEFYNGVGSGAGKRAFFNNNPAEINQPAGTTVDYAGSDSLVTTAELVAYNNPNNANGRSSYGALVQVPSVLTSVTVPYKIAGVGEVDLSSEQLAEVFAGAVSNWEDVVIGQDVNGNDVYGPDLAITVVYRTDGSGTTEIFLRHLNAVNSTLVPSVSNSFSGTINVSSSKYVGAAGSDGVVTALSGRDGAITYVSPDKVEYGNPAKVASINGLLPTAVNVEAAVEEVSVPTGALVNNPLAWGIINANPSAGYPIVASTNLIFSQCYADSGDKDKILSFFDQHYVYNGANKAAIEAGGFIQLPAVWQEAIKDTFGTGGVLEIGATNLCNGVAGRPQ